MTYYPDGEYYEIHYYIPCDDDTHYCAEYRGKAIRSLSTAEKCLNMLRRKFPNLYDEEICLYDETGRID